MCRPRRSRDEGHDTALTGAGVGTWRRGTYFTLESPRHEAGLRVGSWPSLLLHLAQHAYPTTHTVLYGGSLLLHMHVHAHVCTR